MMAFFIKKSLRKAGTQEFRRILFLLSCVPERSESGKPDVFAGVHFEIQVERIGRVRFDDFFHELHENGVLTEDGELVHRLEINRDEEWPLQLWVDPLAALDIEHLRDF